MDGNNDGSPMGFIGKIATVALLSVSAYFLGAHESTSKWEGGYVNDPVDLGGETKYGITEAVARRHGFMDVSKITYDDALEIFHDDFWEPLRLDSIAQDNERIAFLIYDFGVNAGPVRSVKHFQRCLNVLNLGGRRWPDIRVDGRVGARTIYAYRVGLSLTPPLAPQLETCLEGLRTAHYVKVSEYRPANERFTRGWLRRAAK